MESYKIMTSKSQVSLIEEFLTNNGKDFLIPGDAITHIFSPTTTIYQDPRSINLNIPITTRYEIQPKVVFSVKSKGGAHHLGIVEISTTALGLKLIGAMQINARLVNPRYALILMTKSISKELSHLIADPRIGPRLLNYGKGQKISLINS